MAHAQTRAELLGAITTILDAGHASGDLRSDVAAEDVAASLIGIFAVAPGPKHEAQAGRLLNLLMDGLRHTARAGLVRQRQPDRLPKIALTWVRRSWGRDGAGRRGYRWYRHRQSVRSTREMNDPLRSEAVWRPASNADMFPGTCGRKARLRTSAPKAFRPATW
ncbi:SbtR family transcriptional regulator [Amycolatopsis sp. NPDC004378]